MLDFSQYDAFIFDWDNTVAATEPMHIEAMVRAMRELAGYEMTYADCLDYIGSTSTDLAAKIFARHDITDIDPLQVSDHKAALLRQLELGLRLFPGAQEFIEYWSKRKKLALASNSSREFIDRCLTAYGLEKHFSYSVTVSEAASRKPDPAMLHMAANALGSLPERILVFEDSDTGLKAAANGGFPAVLVLNPGNPLPSALPTQLPMHTWEQLLESSRKA
ncbi:MAG: HAD family phosphatase [Lentisphaerae bacterium]|jgi:HAD superfamily hydrolase (TIGR01509 family)|nr:HAD family phosphatase [Lentisphaerota bacterium]